jgi:hypothetical protein
VVLLGDTVVATCGVVFGGARSLPAELARFLVIRVGEDSAASFSRVIQSPRTAVALVKLHL